MADEKKKFEPGYPAWFYTYDADPDLGYRGELVKSSEERNALGDGWVDSPAKVKKPRGPGRPPKVVKEQPAEAISIEGVGKVG